MKKDQAVKLEILDNPNWFRELLSDCDPADEIEALRAFYNAIPVSLALEKHIEKFTLEEVIQMKIASEEILKFLLRLVDQGTIEAFEDEKLEGAKINDAVDRELNK